MSLDIHSKINKKSNEQLYEIVNRWKKLYISMKQNYLITVCIILQIVGFSILYPSNPKRGIISNLIFGLISFIISIFSGYYVHVYSHLYDYEKLYKTLWSSSNFIGCLLRKLPIKIQYILNKFVYLLDFHDKIHHDTSVNKKWNNLLIEFCMNIYTEGVALIILFKLFDFGIHIRGSIFKINYPILFAWSILYATIHNINYNIVTPICHIQHHINEKTNYGIDFMDIIMGSKYDDVPEKMNHASINVIVIMLFIIYIKEFYKPDPNNIVTSYIYNYINWLISY